MESYNERENYGKLILNYKKLLKGEYMSKLLKDLHMIKKTIRKNVSNDTKYIKIDGDKLKNLIDNIHNEGYSMSFIGKGGQGLVIKLDIKNLITFAIKIYYSKTNIYPDTIYPYFTNKIIMNKISPNFVVSSHHPFDNEFIIMELLKDNFEFLIKKEQFNDNVWKGFYFQLFYSVHVLFELEGIVHNDVIMKNVFYRNIKDSYFYFIIVDKNNVDEEVIFKIPTGNKLVMIGDYGKSDGYKLHKGNHAKNLIYYGIMNRDIFRFFSALEHKLIIQIVKNMSLKEVKEVSYKNGDTKIDDFIENSMIKIKEVKSVRAERNPKFYGAMYIFKKKYIYTHPNSPYNFPSRDTFNVLRNLITDNGIFLDKLKKHFNDFIVDKIDEKYPVFKFESSNTFLMESQHQIK